MNAENAVKTAVAFFAIILVGALLSALVGGAFGALVATISPDFVAVKAEAGIVRYAFAVGMIWGVVIGAAVSGFTCFLAAIIKILRIRLEYRKEQETNKPT
jgi:MFS family permease